MPEPVPPLPDVPPIEPSVPPEAEPLDPDDIVPEWEPLRECEPRCERVDFPVDELMLEPLFVPMDVSVPIEPVVD